MTDDLMRQRNRRRALFQMGSVALSAAFYLALIPAAVLLSGPMYEAMRCAVSECEEPGVEREFIMTTRGDLHIGSPIRLTNGERVGEVTGFRRSLDERYTVAVGRIEPDRVEALSEPLWCQAMANFSLEMDADLVLSTCPGRDLTHAGSDVIVCGSVNHFERLGQELRRFVLDNVRPGHSPATTEMTGPCGTDNEVTTRVVRVVLEAQQGR